MAKREERVDDGDHQSEVLVPRVEGVPGKVGEQGVVHEGEDVVFDHRMGVVTTVVLPVMRQSGFWS